MKTAWGMEDRVLGVGYRDISKVKGERSKARGIGKPRGAIGNGG